MLSEIRHYSALSEVLFPETSGTLDNIIRHPRHRLTRVVDTLVAGTCATFAEPRTSLSISRHKHNLSRHACPRDRHTTTVDFRLSSRTTYIPLHDTNLAHDPCLSSWSSTAPATLSTFSGRYVTSLTGSAPTSAWVPSTPTSSPGCTHSSTSPSANSRTAAATTSGLFLVMEWLPSSTVTSRSTGTSATTSS